MSDFLQRWVDASPRNRALYERMQVRASERERAYRESQELIGSLRKENAALKAAAMADESRLRHLGDEPFCDGYGDTDLHEQALECAEKSGRDIPNSDDYLAAVRIAIDRAIAWEGLR